VWWKEREKATTYESFSLVFLSLKPNNRHSRIGSGIRDVRRSIPLASAFDSFHTTIYPRNMKKKEVRWWKWRSVA
jgi:hypothetical protein